MNNSLTLKLRTLLLVLSVPLFTSPAQADMIPIDDLRECSAYATFLGTTKTDFQPLPAPFAYWNTLASVDVPNPDPEGPGSCSATAVQVSQFLPNAISMSGSSGGNWYALPGDYSALSNANFKFHLDTCHQYQFDAWYEPGDPGTESRIRVDVPGQNLEYEAVTTTEVHTTGRLPAGDYEVEGYSYTLSSNEFTQGPTYTVLWTCIPCATTLVRGGPRDLTIGCGANAVLSVEPNAAGLTYQWRRNLVPLTNSSHVAGATSQTLTINNACNADAGSYDVILSDGTIIEPSRLAHLGITTVSAVETPSDGPQPALSIQAAGPNPFSGRMSFRYSAARPLHATIAIYNATGAKIRTLAAGVVSGSGMVTWDGDLDTGVRAPAGIYFLRVEAGSIRENRKIVLVR